MIVKELIELLKKQDPNLPVCLSDWNEQYAVSCLLIPEQAKVININYNEPNLYDKKTYAIIRKGRFDLKGKVFLLGNY